MSFDGSQRRPFVPVGDERITVGAHMLLQELGSALRQVGFRLRIKAFTPHMTLFYSGHDLGDDSVAEISWTAREFAIIHSVHGQSRHEVVASGGLGPAPKGQAYP